MRIFIYQGAWNSGRFISRFCILPRVPQFGLPNLSVIALQHNSETKAMIYPLLDGSLPNSEQRQTFAFCTLLSLVFHYHEKLSNTEIQNLLLVIE